MYIKLVSLNLGGLRLSKIFSVDGELVHEEASLGCETEAPYFFEPVKETPESVELIARKLEDEAHALNNSEITFEAAGKQYTMMVNVDWCQGDGKLWDEICGCKSAYCHICPATEGQSMFLFYPKFQII